MEYFVLIPLFRGWAKLPKIKRRFYRTIRRRLCATKVCVSS